MLNIVKEQVLGRINVQILTQFVGLVGVVMFMPFIIHIQWLTGPIVNAIFILVLFIVGVRAALVVALVPSLMALSSGLLPVVLAPTLPFIMIGNVIYILTINWIYNNSKLMSRGYWRGIIVGSVLKFVFLLFSVNLIVNLLTKKELAVKVAQMMSWSQLVTALAGGMIAWAVLKWLKRI